MRLMPIDLTYSSLQELIRPYQAEARTESRAFLAWYLENVYRLEATVAQDAVCDGPDDKGIDGIFVDDAASRIEILQARTVQRDNKTVGDTQIKEFAGTLEQFQTAGSVNNIKETTRNDELKGLLEELKIEELIETYEIRGVFVTNALTDPSALEFIANSGANIVIRDRNDIVEAYIPAGHAPATRDAVTFNVFGFDVSEYKVGDATVIVAPLAASELVDLDGVQSGEIFDYNVRQYLGRTAVNKDIAKSVQNQAEHQNFLLYHNGITIVAESVDTDTEGKITISNYVIVNGCQSVSVFYDRKEDISSDLRILARIIRLDRSSPLMDLITHHSNNQNGIKPRDFQSNSPIQLRLRNDFIRSYPDQIFYQISRGETSDLPELIDNEVAARVLLAFDLGEPWTSHQTYKMFDDLHARIFARPEVTAMRIVALNDVFIAVGEKLDEVKNGLLAKYTLTKYFLVYLVRQTLLGDELGAAFIQDPSVLMKESNGRARLAYSVKEILQDLIVDLNAEVEEREESGDAFDFKRDLKNETAVKSLVRAILTSYEKAVRRNRAPSFKEVWEKSETEVAT